MRKVVFPPRNEIIYLRGVQNYTEVHLTSGEKILSSYTLLRHQEKLDGFLRVNKSHLLNPRFVLRVNANGTEREVQLRSGKRVKVSRRRKNDVLLKLNVY